jgi:YhcG PDDEXK nuclease domain
LRHKILTAKELEQAKPDKPEEIIKDPYVFEFLGLADNSYTENELEKALVDRLQHFLTELGKGFCFEARQKRIDLAGQDYYIDLVFYHRILKSTILIDLKIGSFVHGYAGQMNYYLNWWKDNEMVSGDQPPIGLILCAAKKDAHVEFALGGIANKIFVSQYKTSLPSKTELQQLLMNTQDRWEKEHGQLPAQEIKRINDDSR